MTDLHVDDNQRRRRLAVRHGIAADHRMSDPLSVTQAITALHATEAASVYLSLHARIADVTIGQIDSALYDERSLVKQLAMRRTLFVFTRELLPAVLGSASARVAATEHRRLAQDIERAEVARDGEAWVDAAVDQIRRRLEAGDELDMAALRKELPVLGELITFGSGKWAQTGAAGSRVGTVAGARGVTVRAHNQGHWRTSRPTWTSMSSWLGEPPQPLDSAAGYVELIRRYLWSFGPASETDIVWWLGATKTAVRSALAELQVVEATLDHDEVGYLLPDDTDSVDDSGDWVALLPALDPTTMGWKQRGFYLSPDDAPYFYDTAGNGGPTAWWNGRIVGTWVQDADGIVQIVSRQPLDPAAQRALEHEAQRLTDWLDGVVVNSIYATPLSRGAKLP